MNELTRILRVMETRAPSAAVRDPNTYIGPGNELRPLWDAERAITQGYLKQTYVFAGVNKTADSIARYPFRAGRNIEDQTRYSDTNPLAKLLGPGLPGPNDEWAVKQFWKYTIAQYILTGKFAWLIERNKSDQIIGLWPLQAQHLIPLEGSGGNYFSGFKYGTHKKFSPDQIIYCWDRSQADYRQAQSWLEASALDISIAQMVDQYDYSLLKNNAIPSTLITTERFAEPGMRRAFRAQFQAQFGGPGNAGKTLFLEADPDQDSSGGEYQSVKEKIHVERLAMTPQELMSDAKRTAVLADVSVALRIPMSVLGDSTRSKDSNMEMDKLNWWSDTLVPLAEDIADHVNTKLVPLLDNDRYRGWFDFSKNTILQPRPRFSAPEYRALYESRIMERDEIRKELGLAPWDDIEHPFVELNEAQLPLRVLDEKPPLGPGSVPAGALPGARPPGAAAALVPGARPPGFASVTPAGGTPRAGTLAGRPRELDPGQIQSLLANAKTAAKARFRGRKTKIDNLSDLWDESYWRAEMAKSVGEEWAQRISDIVKVELREAPDLDTAFERIEREIRAEETIPVDYVQAILYGVRDSKIDPEKAVNLLWQ